MAKKSSTKSNVKTSFTNTKKEKIVVLTTGEKFRNGVSEGGGTKQGFRVVTGKNSGNLRQVKVGSNADTQYNQEGLFTGTGADKAKYSSVNKPIKKPIGMISSQQGKSIVQEADSKINNLSPIDQPTTAPSQGTGTTPLSTPQTGTTPTTPTTPAKTETSNDYITYVNQNTGQEMTLKGSAITEEAKANALKNGYTEASSEISGVKTTPEMAQLQSQIDSATRETDSFMTKLESMIITDKELRGELRTIGAKYKARQSEMEEINKRREVAMTTLGIRTGMRYTGGSGGVMGSILSEEERQGLMRIEQIENDKQEAILNAKKAARDQNFQLYAKLADKAEKTQESKVKELQELKKAQAEQDTKIAEEKQQAEYDALIAEQLATGETDPLKIVQSLSGKVPFDQIKEITELIPKKEFQFISGTENQASGVFDKSTGKFTRTGGGGPTGGTGSGVTNPQAQYWATLIGQGKAKLENVPEKLRSAVVEAMVSGETEPTMSKANEQAYSQADTAIIEIDAVLDGIKEAGTFERFALGNVPGTLARDVGNSIETVQALIGFDALAEMRAASPTGGALGSITEKELRYLQSVQGSLDPLQSTTKLKTTIERIRGSFARIRAINSVGTTAEQYKKQFPDATEEELREIRARSTKKEVQDNAIMNNKDLFNTGSWAMPVSTNDGTDVFKTIGL